MNLKTFFAFTSLFTLTTMSVLSQTDNSLETNSAVGGTISISTYESSNDNKTTSSSSSDYYESVYKLYGTNLRTALHNLIKNHTVVSYASLWTYYQTTDKKPNGKVWDMYSDVPGGTPPYEFTFTTNQCGNYSSEGDCYNREHSWPKSWFNDVSPPYSDLFHLYPTDGKVNGMRNNYPYGDVGTASWTSLNGSKLGASSFPEYTGIVFEPIDEYKGDLARGIFYMSTRYYTEDAGWSTSEATNKSDLLPWYADQLYEWNVKDTVSTKEINRNEAIYGIQKNRNPFVDHPEFVAEIWKTNMAPAVVSVKSVSQTTIVVDFSRYLDSTAAVTTKNYDINGTNPQSVEWGVNNDVSKILITTTDLSASGSYPIQIKNMKSINNVAMNDTTVHFDIVVTIKQKPSIDPAKQFSLFQNYPNPFNPSTIIRYQMPTTGQVTITVYDVLGQEIATLMNEVQDAGMHFVSFDASQLSGGIYFYTLRSGNFSQTEKLLLLK